MWFLARSVRSTVFGAGLPTPPNSGHGRETGPNAEYEQLRGGRRRASLIVGDASCVAVATLSLPEGTNVIE
jgi:hypothetical protein